MKKNHVLLFAAVTLSSALLVPAALADDQLPPSKADAAKAEAPAAPAKKSGAAKAKKAPAPAAVSAEPAKPAAPLTPGLAVARQNNVNVRGQAAINSEVLLRLKKGESVNVLEEVTLKKPKTDEPAKWAKIALPTNTVVWVHTSFLDANKTVKANRLNLRSGPGENYSVVGRLEKGVAVKELETKGEWTKIEPPASAYGFVAAHLLVNETAPALVAAEPPKPAVPTPEPPKPPTPPVVETPVTPPTPTVVMVAPPVETNVVTTPPTPPVAAPPTTPTPPTTPPPTPPVAITIPPLPGIEAPPVTAPTVPEAEPKEEELIKRVISREGIVKRSASIQAPSYFVLESLDTHKGINYLFSTNLVLKSYTGQRIVVTGEEQLDERWPDTPVIYVDSVQPVEK